MKTVNWKKALRIGIIPILSVLIIGCESFSTEPTELNSLEGTWHAQMDEYEMTMEIVEQNNKTTDYHVIGEGEIINKYGSVFFIVSGEVHQRVVGVGEDKKKDLHLTGILSNGVEFLMDLEHSYYNQTEIRGVLTVMQSQHRELIILNQVSRETSL